jgi:phosphoglucomutase
VPGPLSPVAGQPVDSRSLVDVPQLVEAYYANRPDPSIDAQRVRFGTSGHRGSALTGGFNEWHVLAIAQAICAYRLTEGITGPLFLGIDTHALSEPALRSTLEVLAANDVLVHMAADGEYTPTPAISQSILNYNRGRRSGLADGIIITPSHNPPEDGGLKYNPPHGGPAGGRITGEIEKTANDLMLGMLSDVRRVPYEKALKSPTTRRWDYRGRYVRELAEVIDLAAIRSAGLTMAVDPLGGAGVRYWQDIASHYELNLTVTNARIDPTFSFIPADHDGRIRMDPSSPYAMRSLIELRDGYDIAFACDADHDRHGVVTRKAGLLPSNHYLVACVRYLFTHRPQWQTATGVGKTAVSSLMIDHAAQTVDRPICEVPVGFKWFVDGLLKGRLGFAGEESAGSTFLRQTGTVWTTDKDGIVAALLAAEMMARTGRDPGEMYAELADKHGNPQYERIDTPASASARRALSRVTKESLRATRLAGEAVTQVVTHAPCNNEPLGGIKVLSEGGWFAARPSGTEDLYKIYAESLRGADHLRLIQDDARRIVSDLTSEEITGEVG